jgi:hypothetical protein
MKTEKIIVKTRCIASLRFAVPAVHRKPVARGHYSIALPDDPSGYIPLHACEISGAFAGIPDFMPKMLFTLSSAGDFVPEATASFLRLGIYRRRLRRTFFGWGFLAGGYGELSSAGDFVPEATANFLRLGISCRRLRRTFFGWGFRVGGYGELSSAGDFALKATANFLRLGISCRRLRRTFFGWGSPLPFTRSYKYSSFQIRFIVNFIMWGCLKRVESRHCEVRSNPEYPVSGLLRTSQGRKLPLFRHPHNFIPRKV